MSENAAGRTSVEAQDDLSALQIGLARGGLVTCALLVLAVMGVALRSGGGPVALRTVGTWLVGALGVGFASAVVATARTWLERREASLLPRVLIPWLLGALGLAGALVNGAYASAVWSGGEVAAYQDLSALGPAAPAIALASALGAVVLALGLGRRAWGPADGGWREVALLLVVVWLLPAAVGLSESGTRTLDWVLGGFVFASVSVAVAVPLSWIVRAVAWNGEALVVRLSPPTVGAK